jgi:hypothetical protein
MAIVVIALPEQIVWLEFVAVAVGIGFTFILTALLVAGLPVAQVALEVNSTVTLFPSVRVELV